jgi:hypothetical protein
MISYNMSTLSSDHSTSPSLLYCSEVAADVVRQDLYEHSHTTLDCLSDDESSIVSVFDSETDQMLEIESIHRLRGNPGIVGARKDAVNWMLKVHTHTYIYITSNIGFLYDFLLNDFLLSGACLLQV